MRELGYPVYDADNHLYETRESFTRHLPRPYRREVQYVEVNGRTKLLLAGQLSDYIPNPTFDVVAPPGASEQWYRGKNPEGKTLREMFGKPQACQPEYRDPEKCLALLDREGIWASLMFPTLGSALEHRLKHDADLLHAVVHAFNQWLEEDWGFRYRDRIFAVPMITLMDVKRAVEELEWCLERGARTVLLRPAPVPGYRSSRSPGHEEFDPFWARIAEAGIFVSIHSSDSGYEDYAGDWDGGGEYTPFQPSAFRSVVMAERPIFDMIAALICHGVFQRHPGVQVACVENGSGWVKPLLQKLERSHRLMPREFAEAPTETFRRHISVSPFYEEDIRGLVEAISLERVLYGSDYPHPEGLAEPLRYLDELEGFSEPEVQRIMSGNLAALLGAGG